MSENSSIIVVLTTKEMLFLGDCMETLEPVMEPEQIKTSKMIFRKFQESVKSATGIDDDF